MRRTLYCGPFGLAALTLLVALIMPLRLSKAANLFWDGTGTSWNTASFWSTSSSATTPNPAAKPGSADIADFNITTVNTAQTVNLDAAQSALGLVFGSTGPVLIQTGSGANTLAIGLSGITVNVGAGADTISSAVSLAAGQSWTNNSSNLLTDSGTISTGAFSVGGSGNITLSGSVNSVNNVLTKTGSGTLTLSGATDNNSLAVTVNNGTVVLAKTSSSSPNDVHAIGQDLLTVTGGTAQLGGTGGDQIYDLGSVAVTSGAVDTNARSETFSTLNLQGTGNGGAGALVNTAAGASTITPTNGTTLNANTTIGVTQSSGTLTLNNAVSGNFTLTKVGAGTLRLSGNNTFSGGTVINAGTLLVGSDSALGSGGILFTGGTIEADGGPRTILQPVTVQGAVTVDGSQDVTFQVSTDPFAVNNRLTKNGTGTLTLYQFSATLNSDVIVNAGTLALAGISLPSTANLVIGDGTGVDTVQLMLFGGGPPRQLATVTVNSSGVLDLTVTTDYISNLRFNGGSVTGGGLLILNSGAAVTTSVNSQTATINCRVQLADNNTQFDVADGGATIDLDIPANFDMGSLTKTGGGTLRLSGNNTFSGGVTVTGGTLLAASNSALGTFPLTINGGAVDLSTFSAGVAGVNLMAGSLSMVGNLTIGAGGLLGQIVNLDATKSVNLSGTTTIDPTGTLTLNGGTLNTAALAGTGTFNLIGGTLGITGAAGLTIGSGSLVGTTVSLGAGDKLNVTNSLHIGGAGRLTNVGGNVLASNVQIDVGGRWTVTDDVQSVGTGLVNHGTLVLIDTTINGPVTSPAGSTVTVVGGVTFNQLFSGAGQFFGPGTTTLNGGYNPGDSPATVNFQGSVLLGRTNTLAIELGGTMPGTEYDQVHVSGHLSLDGALDVLLTGLTPAAGQAFDILDWGSLSGTFSTLDLPTLPGLAWNTSQLYTTGVLSLVSAGLSGDYNNNGVVDAADYVVWRANQGTNNVLANDPIGGTIGTAQYNQWRAHIGQTAGSGASTSLSAGTSTVPEPSTGWMFGIIIGKLVCCPARKRWPISFPRVAILRRFLCERFGHLLPLPAARCCVQ